MESSDIATIGTESTAVATGVAIDSLHGSLVSHNVLKVIYLFAGAKRKADFGDFLTSLCRERGIGLDLWEID